MKIKIYQVSLDRDEHTAAFRGLYDKAMTEAGVPVVDSSSLAFSIRVFRKYSENVFPVYLLNMAEKYA